MATMNPEVKARWVAALRSGEYKQAKGALRHGDSFCCLGVLCDLYAKDAGIGWRITSNGRADMFGCSALIPDAVNDWAGFENDSMGHERVRIGSETRSLPQFNDGSAENESIQPRTFAEIADAIESQL